MSSSSLTSTRTAPGRRRPQSPETLPARVNTHRQSSQRQGTPPPPPPPKGSTLDQLKPLDEDTQPTPAEPAPSIVTLFHFIHEQEETAEAVIGEPGETLIPVGGLLILGGEGGSSKTTLTLDAVAHICSGTPWMGYPLKRPVRALILENEGPRAQFRDKLRQKTETWEGDDFQHNVYIWE